MDGILAKVPRPAWNVLVVDFISSGDDGRAAVYACRRLRCAIKKVRWSCRRLSQNEKKKIIAGYPVLFFFRLQRGRGVVSVTGQRRGWC